MIEKRFDSLPQRVGIGGDPRRACLFGGGTLKSLSNGSEMAKPWMNGIGPFRFLYTRFQALVPWMGPEMGREVTGASDPSTSGSGLPIRWDLRFSFPGEGVRGRGIRRLKRRRWRIARTRFHLLDAATPGTGDSLSLVDARKFGSDPGDELTKGLEERLCRWVFICSCWSEP